MMQKKQTLQPINQNGFLEMNLNYLNKIMILIVVYLYVFLLKLLVIQQNFYLVNILKIIYLNLDVECLMK